MFSTEIQILEKKQKKKMKENRKTLCMTAKNAIYAWRKLNKEAKQKAVVEREKKKGNYRDRFGSWT